MWYPDKGQYDADMAQQAAYEADMQAQAEYEAQAAAAHAQHEYEMEQERQQAISEIEDEIRVHEKIISLLQERINKLS